LLVDAWARTLFSGRARAAGRLEDKAMRKAWLGGFAVAVLMGAWALGCGQSVIFSGSGGMGTTGSSTTSIGSSGTSSSSGFGGGLTSGSSGFGGGFGGGPASSSSGFGGGFGGGFTSGTSGFGGGFTSGTSGFGGGFTSSSSGFGGGGGGPCSTPATLMCTSSIDCEFLCELICNVMLGTCDVPSGVCTCN
jgi:hypothetical protein